MAAERYTVELTCERVGCENEATLLVAAIGDAEPQMLCIPCVGALAQRLAGVVEQRNELLRQGLSERMVDHIMSARIERKEA